MIEFKRIDGKKICIDPEYVNFLGEDSDGDLYLIFEHGNTKLHPESNYEQLRSQLALVEFKDFEGEKFLLTPGDVKYLGENEDGNLLLIHDYGKTILHSESNFNFLSEQVI